MKNEKVLGVLVASAMAAFVFSGIAQAEEGAAKAAKKAEHFCQNNTCKGHSACKGHGNDSCKGENGCKGHGFMDQSNAKDCKKAGGKWMKG